MSERRGERFLALLHESTTNRTAHTMLPARFVSVANFWSTFFFGVLLTSLRNAPQNEIGFVMIDEDKLYFYPVQGLGRNQRITGRRHITFDQMSRVRFNRGKISNLTFRWRNSQNQKIDVVIGQQGAFGGMEKHFPDHKENFGKIVTLLHDSGVEVKKGRMNLVLIIALSVLVISILFVVLIVYLEEMGMI